MSDTANSLPPELIAEAMTVMGRAFTAIRSATSQNYSMGERLSPERLAALGMLADALHNMPDWLRSDLPVRYRGLEDNVRDELAVAVGAIEFLHGRGPFVPRGPFQADRVHRITVSTPVPSRAAPAIPDARRLTRFYISWIGGLAAACGLLATRGLGRRLKS